MSMICGSEDKERFKARFEALVKQALPLTENILDKKFEVVREHKDSLVLKTEDNLTFKLANFQEYKKSILARIDLVGQSNLIYTDTISLSSGKSRKQFINKCLEMKGSEEIDPLKMEKYLMAIEPIIKEKISDAVKHANSKKKVPEMTLEGKEEAMKFLKNTLIMEELKEDSIKLGHVGEVINKVLLYLICTSRKLDKPLACIIRAGSSAGKNALVSTILDLMPPEETKIITRLTANALFYCAQDLEHRILHVAEKVGTEEADYSLRSLISERILTVWVPTKNPGTGEIETQEVTVRGPVAYIETTALPEINVENDTRLFSIYIDESEQQTKRIHEIQRKEKTLNGLIEEIDRDAIRRKHQNAQRLLHPIKIVIPYANEIIFPTYSVRTRRDHEKFLYLIMAIGLLRQHQKGVKYKDGIAYIEADLRDYKWAYELGQAVLNQTIDEVSKKARDLMVIIKDMVSQLVDLDKDEVELHDKLKGSTRTNIIFTRANVRNFAKGWSDASVYSHMRELARYELLRVIQGGQGRVYKYTLAGEYCNSENGEGKLLTPQELKAKLNSLTLQKLSQKS